MGLLNCAFLILIVTVKSPSKSLNQLTLPLTMLTSFCFPTALPTECIIKLLGVCQSDRWKWCLKIVWLAFLWFWVRLSNFFICLGANSISFVVASLLYFAHILWGSWPFSWQIYLKFIHIKKIISLGYEPGLFSPVIWLLTWLMVCFDMKRFLIFLQ